MAESLQMSSNVTFLGTGTSHGVPKINCECDVCRSSDERDKRLRCSIMIEHRGLVALIDTSADFRQQALRAKIKKIDSIIFTHAHADHIHGIDDIRAYQTKISPPIKCFASPSFCDEMKRRFDYIFFEVMPAGGGIPRIELSAFNGPFKTCGIDFIPLEVVHGEKNTYGYRFLDIAYISDVKSIPEKTMAMLCGIKILIIDALRLRPHSTHNSFDESIDIVKKVRPIKTYFTHIDHEIMHGRESEMLKKRGLTSK